MLFATSGTIFVCQKSKLNAKFSFYLQFMIWFSWIFLPIFHFQFQLLYNFAVFFFLFTSKFVSLAQYFFYCPCSMFLFHSVPSIWQLRIEEKEEKNDFQVYTIQSNFSATNKLSCTRAFCRQEIKEKKLMNENASKFFSLHLISLFYLLDMYCYVSFSSVCIACNNPIDFQWWPMGYVVDKSLSFTHRWHCPLFHFSFFLSVFCVLTY